MLTHKCDKKRFASKEEAIERIKQIAQEEAISNKKPHRAYYCKGCGGWHLSSWTKKDYKKRHYVKAHQTHREAQHYVERNGLDGAEKIRPRKMRLHRQAYW